MLKSWINTGVSQKLTPESNIMSVAGNSSSSNDSSNEGKAEEGPRLSRISDLLCPHGKFSYHKLKQIKFIEKDVISKIVDDGTSKSEISENHETKTENMADKPWMNHEDEVKPIAMGKSSIKESENIKLIEIEKKPISLMNLMLCEECVVTDLKQHLYELALEDDFKKICILQNRDPETGWWVLKDDFRNFKKIVRQG